MGLLQSTASAGDPLSMSEVVSHFGQSGEKSLRQFLRNGGIVASSKSATTNISGSGAGSGSSGSMSVSVSAGSQAVILNSISSGSGAGDCTNINTSWNQYQSGGDLNQGYFYSGSGCSGNWFPTGNTGGNWYSGGNAAGWPSARVFAGENAAGITTRRVSTVYTITFTNNYPNSVTITSGTGGARTIAAGASAQVQTNGGSNSWSFTGTTTSSTSINSSIPESGTLSLLNFLSADNGA